MTHHDAAANPLLEELRWVHAMLRRDLQACRTLAAAATDGAPAAAVREDLERLQAHSPLFAMRLTCIRYCHLVHAHHGAEDQALFPAVRRSAPDLAGAVDRLEADHASISVLLDEVESLHGGSTTTPTAQHEPGS
jgi:hypothetical protein